MSSVSLKAHAVMMGKNDFCAHNCVFNQYYSATPFSDGLRLRVLVNRNGAWRPNLKSCLSADLLKQGNHCNWRISYAQTNRFTDPQFKKKTLKLMSA
jgi:hypothetical protein